MESKEKSKEGHNQQKIAPNWEGSFRIKECLQNEAYQVEHLEERSIWRTWNATHLNFYYR